MRERMIKEKHYYLLEWYHDVKWREGRFGVAIPPFFLQGLPKYLVIKSLLLNLHLFPLSLSHQRTVAAG